MPEPSVHFESVWKKFHRGEHHDTMRDAVLSVARRALGRRRVSQDPDEFWAVRDVSFDVRPGETLGIIGGNGAGKSTVLKLLTRIFRPDRGVIRVEGRIGALIEVSAGFHPDLTGRENIFLQGSLMGMRKATIEKRFDEIVEFSGISEFLDTPVKRYSSGMNARLGFSIAAHLDPDVLIIDEVLAVGDFRFQQRAFERLQELAQSGRPVIVVSHQLDRITQLCSKAVLLTMGRVAAEGTPSECVAAYLAQGGTGDGHEAPVTFGTPTVTPGPAIPVGAEFTVDVTMTRRESPLPDAGVGLRVRSLVDNQGVFWTTTHRQEITIPRTGVFTFRCDLRAHLIPGHYVIEFFTYNPIGPRSLSSSAPVHVQVLGDHSATGRAHLGGRLELRESMSVPKLPLTG